MFGWLASRAGKRVVAKMETLAYLANLVTAFGVDTDLKSRLTNKTDKEKAYQVAARTNFLFGKELAESHKSIIAGESEAAIAWLRGNPLFRELVVQSLRVMNTAKYAKGKEGPVIGEEVLGIFGNDYPAAPEPGTYEALVLRAIESLPDDAKAEVANWAKRQGI